jgi:two-component system, NtrC family, sensor kinase
MAQAQASEHRSERRSSRARLASPAVLVVDDVEANLVSLEALLEGMGCEVVLARSGNAALRELLHREFAVMLLDVQMPEMDGYEVARYVSQDPATREVPIVFLTAMHDDPDSVLRGYTSGAVDFLFKPVNPAIVRSKVRVFLELYRGRRQIEESRLALEQSHAELAHAYQNLAATQSQLVQSAKMASLGELVAGVAHEINNPLAFVQSHLHTARRSLGLIDAGVRPSLDASALQHWERAHNRLSEMSLGIERMTDLVVRLRTFSRLDEGEVKTVSVRECVESVLTISRHRLGERIRLLTEYGEPELIECYPGLLNQALMNLVSNAIDAIEGDGVVTIRTGNSRGQYRISVADTGPGIPEALRHRVCEPFFTTKPPGQGTGLGLSITYSIVQKHRGTLDIEDNPGGGTLITISIPERVEQKGREA